MVLCMDVETFYDPATKYSLKNLPTEQYVRDARFETIGWGIDDGEGTSQWMEHAEFQHVAKYIDWARCAVIAHNAMFDCFVLSHHYDVHPGFMLDTLSMARALHGMEVGNSLKKLVVHYGVGEKGDEILRTMGKRRRDFTQEEWLRYGEYCVRGDVPVVLADGTTRRIVDLVNGRSTAKVMSYNTSNGLMEPQRICGWYKSKAPGQKWVRIKTTKLRGMVVTPDHKVFALGRGWVRADAVRRGDALLLAEEGVNSDRAHALMGTLLGDSSFALAPSYRGGKRPPVVGIQGIHKSSSKLAQEKVRLLGGIASLGK